MTADEVCAHSPHSPHVIIDHHPLQMHELGFDGYAIDFVDRPQAMRGFLMRECQSHRTVRPALLLCELCQCFMQAIAFQTGRLDPARAMEVVFRTGGGSYLVGKPMNIVTRSQYGQRLLQNLTRDVERHVFSRDLPVYPTSLGFSVICSHVKLPDQSTPLRGAISS